MRLIHHALPLALASALSLSACSAELLAAVSATPTEGGASPNAGPGAAGSSGPSGAPPSAGGGVGAGASVGAQAGPPVVPQTNPQPGVGLPSVAPTLPAGPAAGSARPPAGSEEAAAFDLLNAFRRQVGLQEVAWDPEMADGTAKHAQYLTLNHGDPSIAGFGAHKQEPGRPGYTPEGAKAASAGNVHEVPPQKAMQDWIDSLYHRFPFVEPGLSRVGIGYAKREDGVDYCAFTYDTVQVKEAREAIAYPADGQRDVLLHFPAGEFPDPIPQGAARPVGYPITLTFQAPNADIQVEKAVLLDAKGQAVPVHLGTPSAPASELYKDTRTVSLIAKAPLAPDATYRVEVVASVKGAAPKTHAWSFHTLVPKEVKVADADAHLGQLVYLVGKVLRGGRLGGGEAYWQLEGLEGRLMTVWISKAQEALLPPLDQVAGRQARVLGFLTNGSGGKDLYIDALGTEGLLLP